MRGGNLAFDLGCPNGKRSLCSVSFSLFRVLFALQTMRSQNVVENDRRIMLQPSTRSS